MLVKSIRLGSLLCVLIPIALFWIIVSVRIPYSLSGLLSSYSGGLFLVVLVCYYLAFRLRSPYAMLAGLTLTMLLFALSVSFAWTSGYTDTAMIGGLLPYKDAKNYYWGSVQLLNGLPLQGGINAVRRPLFPGLMASLLFITAGDFKIAIALLTQLTGIAFYSSARLVRLSFGAWAAGLYAALMVFYIQPKLGYNVSELPGFMLGCWAFSILWISAARRSRPGLMLGLLTLMTAISVRAGAFLVFPALVVWAGWVYRGESRFSIRAALICAAVVGIFYFLVNTAVSTLLGANLSDQFGNFAYAMYGQVHGGTGWHSAIEQLLTADTNVVAAEALRFFLAHPLSFFIAALKSYRQFFLPGAFTIFAFGQGDEPVWLTYLLWTGTMALLVLGLVKSVRNLRFDLPALVWACFVGILLSIPFLPPVDSGARFQASTMPFFFLLPAAALGRSADWLEPDADASRWLPGDLALASGSAVIFLILTLIAPVLIFRLTPSASVAAPVCDLKQQGFVIRALPETYIDLLPAGTQRCGLLPDVCLTDFSTNATDKTSDDFIRAVIALAESTPGGIRLTPALNLLDKKFQYFAAPAAQSRYLPAGQLFAGCADEIALKNASILEITSLTAVPVK
jgi:hypothetical protein